MSCGYTFKTVSILTFINWIYLLPLQLPHYNPDQLYSTCFKPGIFLLTQVLKMNNAIFGTCGKH